MAQIAFYIVAAFVLVLAFLPSAVASPQKGLDPMKQELAKKLFSQWNGLVAKYHTFFPTVPMWRVFSHMAVESAGKADSVGDKNLPEERRSYGLMQVRDAPDFPLSNFNKELNKSYTWKDLITPHISIEVGFWNLSTRIRRFGDLDKASQAYNVGDKNIGSKAALAYLSKVKSYDGYFFDLTNGE